MSSENPEDKKQLQLHEEPSELAKQPPEELLGDKVVLRKRALIDAEELYSLIDNNREHLGLWLPFVQNTTDVSSTEAYLKAVLEKWKKHLVFDFSIFLKSSGKMVGSIGLHNIEWDKASCEVGYWIKREAQGQGYVTESLSLIENAALGLGLHRLGLVCDRFNEKSIAVAHRNGFELEARQIDESKRNGVWRDALRFVKLLNPRLEKNHNENLPRGYSISMATKEEFRATVGSLLEDIFSQNELNVWPAQVLSESEREKLATLNTEVAEPYSLNLILWHQDQLAGWSTGRQDTRESYCMTNSAILSEHRGRGLYGKLLKVALQELARQGFQRIWSRHKVTNNKIIIPKLKCGFVISGVTISELAGTLVELTYLTNSLRKKILAFRAGQVRPDEEIKKIFRLE